MFLLDTQALINLTSSPKSFGKKSLNQVTKSNTNLVLSYASIWELSIKLGLKKITLPMGLEDFIFQAIKELSIELLKIEFKHLLLVEKLESIHRDPFDRLIYVQAKHERMKIISSDKIFDRYDPKIRVW